MRALELCVGAGGLALAAARAGFDELTAVDVSGPACETLRLNKSADVEHVRDWRIVEADIRRMVYTDYVDIDLLSGGPPCQPFSQAGKKDGRSDVREMFPEFIRSVRECRPKTFVIENVKGLHNRSFFNYFNYVVHQLRFPEVQRRNGEKWTQHRQRLERLYTSGKDDGTHYKVVYQVLNGANFGVGQRRERVFIVGVRADLEMEYGFPLATHSRDALWHEQWVTGSYWERHDIVRRHRPQPPAPVTKWLSTVSTAPENQAWRTVRDCIADLPNLGPGRTSKKVANHFFNPGAKAYPGHDGSAFDAPAKTIKAGHNGVPGGENTVRLDNGSVRYFTVRECARLQSFPDEWAFEGSWCSCMNQIGNAVPVTLGEVVIRPIATALRKRQTGARR